LRSELARAAEWNRRAIPFARAHSSLPPRSGLLPFVNSFILLMALVWVVLRFQPMVLALWLGAMGTEIATCLVANLLHALGRETRPTPCLGERR
jgi:small neutral amino acid transporter SnatA (MarC family)